MKVPIRQFVGDLCHAMETFFDCKSYSMSYPYRVHFVFYGIAQNAASAAMAFEWIYNLIVDWARHKKGIAATNSYCLGISDGLWRDARKEKAEELERAKEAEAEALAKRLKEEELQRQKELERLQPTVEDESDPESAPQQKPAEDQHQCVTPDMKLKDPESRIDPPDIVDLCETSSESSASDLDDDLSPLDDSSDEESDSDVYEADIVNDESDDESPHFANDDDEIDHLAENTYKQESRSVSPPHRLPSPSSPIHIPSASPSPPKPVTPPREETPETEPQWKSAMQLTLFRQTAIQVADDYLKSKDLKLRHRRRGATAKDPKAFKQGQKDSRKIDVRQKALEEKKDGEEL